MTVYILSGISGCGKSTYAAKLPAKAVFSTDDYFMRNGKYEFDASRLSDAHELTFKYFLDVVEHAENIVIDNTNIDPIEIAPYHLAGRAHGHEVKIINFKVDIKDLPKIAKRNLHNVPENTVKMMWERQRDRKLPPWWTVIDIAVKL